MRKLTREDMRRLAEELEERHDWWIGDDEERIEETVDHLKDAFDHAVPDAVVL